MLRCLLMLRQNLYVGGNKNKLSDDNRKRILKAFIDRKKRRPFLPIGKKRRHCRK